MTFLQIYTDVLDRLGESGTGIIAKVKTWINQTYLDICRRDDFPFLETTATFSEVDNTETVSISSITYSKIIDVVRTEPTTGIKTTLQYLSPQEYANKTYDFNFTTANGTAGDPRFYTVFGTSLMLFPKPDENGSNSLSVRYYTVPAELSADADVPVIPSAYHKLLVLGAYATGLEETEDAQSTLAIKQEVEAGIERMSGREPSRVALSDEQKQQRIETQANIKP